MFTNFKTTMQRHFAFMLANGQGMLYTTDVNKDLLWEAYIGSFPEAVKQEYNCNCCKSFIRHYGNVVTLIDNQIKTIWDFPCEAPFDHVVQVLHDIVSKAAITNLFVTKAARLGTDSNVALEEGGTTIRWHHMYFGLPSSMIHNSTESVDTAMGAARDNRNVFKRGLDELTFDAIDTVLDLIAQNSLYRGAEYKGILDSFRTLKVAYDVLPAQDKDNFCWAKAPKYAGSVAQIRNTAIGTLLINISEGVELDVAVGKFEAIMAPANYKRPTAILSKRMIEEAEKTIEALGYANSLGRRFATVDDLAVTNLLFVNRDIKKAKGLLGDLKETVAINPKSFSKIDEISVADFLSNVLPKSTSIEVLFEDKHVNNLVSLITAKDAKSQGLFKWPNQFSWSYKNAVTDSIKEKVKSAGGQVEGELRVSLEWYNFDDLDLHVVEPDGREIYFRDKESPTGGKLDVDMNAGSGKTREAVENIIWPEKRWMQEGRYRVYVNQFAARETIDNGFSVEIECQGQLLSFAYDRRVVGRVLVVDFSYDKTRGITEYTIGELDGMTRNAKVNSKTVWGVDTNRFHKASMILNSPNFWDGGHVGNAHLLFILDQAHNDEQARGFFNEFLSPELEVHKRVFEALGSRMKVEPADKQVSGLGFSSTQHTDLIVKVDGHFTRTLKIKF